MNQTLLSLYKRPQERPISTPTHILANSLSPNTLQIYHVRQALRPPRGKAAESPPPYILRDPRLHHSHPLRHLPHLHHPPPLKTTLRTPRRHRISFQRLRRTELPHHQHPGHRRFPEP